MAALHEAYLRRVRAEGRVLTLARVHALRHDGARWTASTPAGDHTAPVLVNAAGAWADEIAALAGATPAGLVPRRRTACLVDPAADAAAWPLLNDVPETFYCKPESGALLVCPADAEPDRPGDVRARDLDVAIGIDRLEQATTLSVRSVRHAWAGLRTSPADDLPVIGADPGTARPVLARRPRWLRSATIPGGRAAARRRRAGHRRGRRPAVRIGRGRVTRTLRPIRPLRARDVTNSARTGPAA